MKNNPLKTYQIQFWFALFSFLAAPSFAQTISYKQSGKSSVEVKGTSTLHNWEMISPDAMYEAAFKVNPQGNPVQLDVLKVTIPAESLKSGKNAMDKNAYNSLKTDKFNTIVFTMISSKMEGERISCSGNLAIAGVINKLDVETTCKRLPDNSLQCKGSKTFKMSDYKVDPPSFMMGTIKTGDEITILFDVTLSPVKSLIP